MRKTVGLSRDDIVERTGINTVTLYRLETARVRPQRRTLTTLLDLYGVKDPKREETLELLEQSDRLGWLQPYHDDLKGVYTAFISLEADAKELRNYESLFIPGLLQTGDYARAVIEGVLPEGVTERDVDQRVLARMQRQNVFHRRTPLKLSAIVDEAALHRVVGSRKVMADQLKHLLTMAERPYVTLRVVPFSAGTHPGMSGSLVLMDFPDAADASLVYVEGMGGDQFLESEAEIDMYEDVFDRIHSKALEPDASTHLIADLACETERE